jgi:transposase
MQLTQAKTVIGMDIGKKYSWCNAISSESGEVLKDQKMTNEQETFREFAKELPHPILLVMEATGSWQYLYECWQDIADEIQMAHPYKVKAIASAKIKTDKIDASTLAHLGLANLVPQSYCPPREIRDVREVLRHRAFLVALQTKIKNRIHSILWKLGIQTGQTDLFGKAGLAYLKALELREPYPMFIDQDLKLLDCVQQQIKQTTLVIQQLAQKDIRVEWLLPIRGIGEYSAMLIIAEIGDITRFPTPKQLVSYAGLCPSTHQSGKVSYHGSITKQGSKWLRWILVEASQHYAKVPGRFGNHFRRIARKKGSKTARISTARELLHAIFYCLTKKQAFKESPIHRSDSKLFYFSHAPRLSGR